MSMFMVMIMTMMLIIFIVTVWRWCLNFCINVDIVKMMTMNWCLCEDYQDCDVDDQIDDDVDGDDDDQDCDVDNLRCWWCCCDLMKITKKIF